MNKYYIRSLQSKIRSGSSIWLEHLPVTQEVAGSSPVRTAFVSLVCTRLF